ncbi:MAG: hypothetical protein ACHREM_33685, partial [Polyangiales bacterium]
TTPTPTTPTTATTATTMAPTPAPSVDPFTAEVALIDEARRAVASGHASDALKTLARYDRDLARKQLASEAELVRIDALDKTGAHEGAAAHAHAFILAHPGHPMSAVLARRYP